MESAPGVDALVARHTARLRVGGPYRPPRADEEGAVDALGRALLGDGASLRSAAAAAGFAASEVEGRTVLAADPWTPRAWGLVVLPRGGGRPELLLEVPHPGSDLRTERVALAVDRRVDGALLLVAGAHRRAGVRPAAPGVFPADVAHRADAVFSRLAAHLVGAWRLPQLQLHGCADRDGFDVVVSPGAAASSALLEAVAERIAGTGERVRRGGDPGCAELSGTRNEQGRLAARAGTPFVHLELSRSLRRDAARVGRLATALAAAIATS